jgi:hypothetical protein
MDNELLQKLVQQTGPQLIHRVARVPDVFCALRANPDSVGRSAPHPQQGTQWAQATVRTGKHPRNAAHSKRRGAAKKHANMN